MPSHWWASLKSREPLDHSDKISFDALNVAGNVTEAQFVIAREAKKKVVNASAIRWGSVEIVWYPVEL
jgi:hypothetical protein